MSTRACAALGPALGSAGGLFVTIAYLGATSCFPLRADATDAGSRDAGGAEDAAPFDASPAAVVSVDGAALLGYTSDGLLAYGTPDGYFVMDPTGAVTGITPPGTPVAGTTGSVGGAGVFVFGPRAVQDGGPDLASIAVWTKGAGYHALATAGDPDAPPVTSDDASKVAYALAGNSFRQIVVANADGTDASSPFPQPTSVLSADGAPFYFLAGDVLFVEGLAPSETGGGPAFDLLYPPTYESKLNKVTDAAIADPTGHWILAVDSSSNGFIVDVEGAKSTRFDTQVSVAEAQFDDTGANLYYAAGGALKRVPPGTPANATIVTPAEVTAPVAVSPDGSWVECTNGDQSVSLISTTGEETRSVPAGSLAGNPLDPTFGGFTADGSHFFYGVNGGNYGLLLGVAPIEATSASTIADQVTHAQALTDTRLLVLGSSPYLAVFDAALGKPEQLLCGFPCRYGVYADGSRVAYQPEDGGSIYVLRLR